MGIDSDSLEKLMKGKLRRLCGQTTQRRLKKQSRLLIYYTYFELATANSRYFFYKIAKKN